MFEKIMRKIVKVLDTRFEKYRVQKSVALKTQPKYTPKTLEEFIEVLQRTPQSILTAKDRARVAAIMSFEERTVGELMAGREKIVFVKQNEVLGPLVLDRLYKSGFMSFPVVDEREKVVGIIHTDALNTLVVKKTEKAGQYMDKKVNYLKKSDTLEMMVDEIKQTDGAYFLVNDEDGKVVGCMTIQMLLGYLVGEG